MAQKCIKPPPLIHTSLFSKPPPGEDYSSISRQLFTPQPSALSYYFDFDSHPPLHTRTLPNPLIAAYPAFSQHQRLVPLRHTHLFSIAFKLRLTQPPSNNNRQNLSQHQHQANLFTLNTFDNLSHNRIYLIGVDLLAQSNNTSVRFQISTSRRTVTSLPISDYRTISSLNLTIESDSIQLHVNTERVATLNEKITASLLTAYSPFMLNFTSGSISSNNSSQNDVHPVLNACLSELRVATRKTSPDNQDDLSVVSHDLIRLTKMIYLLNDSPYENRMCQQMESGFENDEILGKEEEGDQECFLIEKVSIGTNEKLNKTYHCKCQDSDSCPYDFWSSTTEVSSIMITETQKRY